MLADLHKLASRKLLEARFRAKTNIDQWEAIVVFVSQLGKQAEITINLPEWIASDITQARAEVNSANYLAALQIGERATNALKEAKARSREQLQATLNQRAAKVSAIKNDIERITSTRDNNNNAANNAQQNAFFEAEWCRKSTLSTSRQDFTWGCLGTIGAVAGLIIYGYMCIANSWDMKTNFYFWVLSGVFGYFTPIIIWNVVKRLYAKMNAADAIRSAKTSWRIAMTEAESSFRRDIIAPQTALIRAQDHWQKAFDAINRLTAWEQI